MHLQLATGLEDEAGRQQEEHHGSKWHVVQEPEVRVRDDDPGEVSQPGDRGDAGHAAPRGLGGQPRAAGGVEGEAHGAQHLLHGPGRPALQVLGPGGQVCGDVRRALQPGGRGEDQQDREAEPAAQGEEPGGVGQRRPVCAPRLGLQAGQEEEDSQGRGWKYFQDREARPGADCEGQQGHGGWHHPRPHGH